MDDILYAEILQRVEQQGFNSSAVVRENAGKLKAGAP
jgi:hypothetical protein